MKKKALNEQTEQKKKPSKKSIALYSSLGAATIAAGVIVGVLLGQNYYKVDTYRNIRVDIAEQDYGVIYERFKNTSSSEYFDSFTPVELTNIALLKLGDVSNFYSISTGQVEAAGVKQTIHATTIKDGNNYFEESLSASSFVKSANRFYQNEETAEWYKGKFADINGGDYSNAKLTNYTPEEFDEIWGKSLTRPCIYIISNKTCLESTIKEVEGDNYQIELNLDPTLSVIRYVKQMTMTAGLSESPVFHTVKLTFTIDKDVNLLCFQTYEVYDVHMVIDAKNSKGSLTQTFFYEERSIPQLEEKTQYDY